MKQLHYGHDFDMDVEVCNRCRIPRFLYVMRGIKCLPIHEDRSKYMPHQGKRECARRRAQLEKGMHR